MSIYLKKLTQKPIYYYILVGLCLIGFYLSFLFWQKGTLSVYDASGHLAAVESMRNFWPFMSGWNAKELLGWPQGIFYPSLFHYLAAGLSFVVGSSTAVRLLISLAFTSLPITIFLFARSFIKDRFWVTLSTVVLFALLLFLPDYLGAGVRSIFRVGLLPSFFVMPLFFLFASRLPKLRSGKFLSGGLLLSLVLLTHIVAGIIGILFLISFFVGSKIIQKDFSPSPFLKLGLLVLGLTSFFYLPFLVLRQYASITNPEISSYLLPNLIGLLVSLFFLLIGFRKQQQSLFILALASCGLLFLTSLDAVVTKIYGFQSLTRSFYLFRFQPFAFIFFLASLVIYFSNLKFFSKKLNSLILIAALGAILIGLFVKNPALDAKAQIHLESEKAVAGRFIESFRRLQTFPAYYEFQTSLNRKNSNANWANGLFAESGSNSQFVQSLIKSLNPSLYSGKEGVLLETKFIDSDRVNSVLDLLGINYVVNFESARKNVLATWVKGKETKYYNLSEISQKPIFEITNLNLVPIKVDWNKQVEEWWLEKGPIKDLPYFATKSTIEFDQSSIGQSQVEVVSQNHSGTRYVLKVSGNKKVPILAKISYFPSWKAYSSGKEVPVYRAGPSMMLFAGQGEVILEYQTPSIQIVGYLISLLTFGVFVLALFKRRNQN